MKRKVRELKVALSFFSGAIKFAAPQAAQQHPAPAAGRGAGGTKSAKDAVDELRSIPSGSQATTMCPFMGTARGCIKRGCVFKH